MIHNITRHGYHRIPYGKYTIQSLLSMRLRKKARRHWPPMLEIGRWTRNVLTPCTVGLVPVTRRLSHWWYFYWVRVSIGIWGALAWGLADRGAVCTRRDRSTVVACAKLRYDRWGTFWTGARQILIGFRVRSGYRCWDGRQSCEICTSTSVLMTKIFFHFVFVLYLCCSLVVLCHVTLAINCTKLNLTTPDQIYPTSFISKGCEIRINVSNFILWFCYLRVTYLTCYGYIWW